MRGEVILCQDETMNVVNVHGIFQENIGKGLTKKTLLPTQHQQNIAPTKLSLKTKRFADDRLTEERYSCWF